MISHLAKNLCPLLLLAMTIGCGKKISEPKVSEDSNAQTQTSRSTDLTLQVDEVVSTTTIFQLPRNAWFILPAKLIVTDGNAAGKK